MEQAPLISIIMPVYNAGVLLHTAVESVLRQSFADFELLLVDDGSTDGSAALAHELAKKDGRIRVLEQPNAGICAARNLGLQHCRGQWFTFCDDDDTMLPHALETLLVLAKSTGRMWCVVAPACCGPMLQERLWSCPTRRGRQ